METFELNEELFALVKTEHEKCIGCKLSGGMQKLMIGLLCLFALSIIIFVWNKNI